MSLLQHSIEHRPTQERPPRPLVNSVGFWAAIATATLSAAWLASVVVQVAVAPVPDWQGVGDYAGRYSEWHLLPLYPSLLLAIAFLILLAALHLRTDPERRIWSLSAMAVAVLYAAMASINYNVQVVSVRRNIVAGDVAGLDMFPLANPDAITRALGNSYVYMSLAMVLAGLAFGSQQRDRWIKRLLVFSGLAAPLQFVWSMFGTPYLLEASLLPWVVGAIVAPVFISVAWRRDTDPGGDQS